MMNGLVPVNVAHQLGECLVHYGSPPDDGLPLVDEVAHGDELQSLRGLYGEDHTPTTLGLPKEPSITGIEEPCTSASSISTECPARSSAAARLTATVDLPTPPLPLTTAMMRVLTRPERRGDLRGTAVKGGEQVLPVLVGHHAEVDLNFLDAFDQLEALCDVRGDPVLERAASGGEGDADRDVRARYVDAADHVQRDEVASDLRVPYVPQSLPDASLRQSIRRLMDLSPVS